MTGSKRNNTPTKTWMYMGRGAAVLLATSLGFGCQNNATKPEQGMSTAAKKPVVELPPVEAAATPERVADGAKLVETFECSRCHDGTELKPAPLNKHCVHCHQEIHAGTFDQADAATQAEWKANIIHLTRVPQLAGTARFRRSWLATFLQAPHDLRPGLDAEMPRLKLEPAQAEAIAAFLVPRAEQTPEVDWAAVDTRHGKLLLKHKGCMTCHKFSGAGELPAGELAVPVDEATLRQGTRMAPDLRFTRDRMRPNALLTWLQDPQKLKPATLMPDFDLSPTQARDIAAFLLTAKLEAVDPPAIPERLPVLTRPVHYPEVEAKVFKKICWHCHSDPDYALGDGGPGNTGGFGFHPRYLNLASYEGISSGFVNDKGERESVFKKLPDGTPRVVAQMMARYAEVAGQPVDGLRGMPMGLPPMTLEEIQLVDTWISQGRPR